MEKRLKAFTRMPCGPSSLARDEARWTAALAVRQRSGPRRANPGHRRDEQHRAPPALGESTASPYWPQPPDWVTFMASVELQASASMSSMRGPPASPPAHATSNSRPPSTPTAVSMKSLKGRGSATSTWFSVGGGSEVTQSSVTVWSTSSASRTRSPRHSPRAPARARSHVPGRESPVWAPRTPRSWPARVRTSCSSMRRERSRRTSTRCRQRGPRPDGRGGQAARSQDNHDQGEHALAGDLCRAAELRNRRVREDRLP